MRGNESTTMSHAEMFAEMRAMTLGEVIEAARHIRAAHYVIPAGLMDGRPAIGCCRYDGQIGRPATWVRADAVAGRNRVRRLGV